MEYTEEELEVLQNEIGDLSMNDLMDIMASLEDYESTPVTIDQFIEDPFYLGGITEAGSKIYPVWRHWLREIYPDPYHSPYAEICVTGAIGIGKSLFGLIGQSYDMYRVSLLKDPHKKFGTLSTKPIAFAMFNATMSLVGGVNGSQFEDILTTSPYFKNLIESAKHEKHMFPNKLTLIEGSRFSHALGMDVISAQMDEANFQDKVADQAIKNYSNLKRRMESRFVQKGGTYFCRFWILSSKTDTKSFLESHIEKSRSNKSTLVIEMPIWEAHAHKDKYEGATFFNVFVGDENKDPFIIDDSVPIPAYIDDSRIISVPDLHKESFEHDLIGSLRDIAGVSTSSSYKLFKRKEIIHRIMIVPKAFTSDVIHLSETGKDKLSDHLTDFLRSLQNKTSPRFIHIDTSLTGDRTGFAMTHAYDVKKLIRINAISGEKEIFNEHITRTDFAIGIKNTPGEEIPFFKIREFIVFLRDVLTFNIMLISTDGYQSADMRQMLRQLGFETDEISVDKKKDAYLSYKSATTDGRAFIPANEILLEEHKDVEDTGKKIDHTDEGTKDILDAVVGSRWACIHCDVLPNTYVTEMLEQMQADTAVKSWGSTMNAIARSH